MRGYLLFCVVAVLIAGTPWADDPPRGHEWVDDPFVAVSKDQRVIAPVRVWLLDEHVNVQVNTNGAGANIVGDATDISSGTSST